MTEMALVSSRKTRLQQRADSGDAGAQKALARLSGFDPQNNEFIFSDHVVSMSYKSVSP